MSARAGSCRGRVPLCGGSSLRHSVRSDGGEGATKEPNRWSSTGAPVSTRADHSSTWLDSSTRHPRRSSSASTAPAALKPLPPRNTASTSGSTWVRPTRRCGGLDLLRVVGHVGELRLDDGEPLLPGSTPLPERCGGPRTTVGGPAPPAGRRSAGVRRPRPRGWRRPDVTSGLAIGRPDLARLQGRSRTPCSSTRRRARPAMRARAWPLPRRPGRPGRGLAAPPGTWAASRYLRGPDAGDASSPGRRPGRETRRLPRRPHGGHDPDRDHDVAAGSGGGPSKLRKATPALMALMAVTGAPSGRERRSFLSIKRTSFVAS